MLGKVFLKELRGSNLFRSVDLEEKTPSLILEIQVASLLGGYDRKTRVARGTVTIHSILKSRTEERVIFDRNYEETSSSLVWLFANAYHPMVAHVGKALNTVISSTRSGI
jgi:hypothetical protein